MKPDTPPITFTLNEQPITVTAVPSRPLLDVLRHECGLTGTKQGCDQEGQCGACTVLVDGRARRACLTDIADVQSKQITTIEGVGGPDGLHPLQQAFIDYGAVQCGYCTPGMVLSAKALLDRKPNPTAAEVARALQGNLCRCTGYVKIVEAVLAAAARQRQIAEPVSPVDAPDAIGEHLRRPDALGKVTGATRYAGDMTMPGMLTITVVRSPHAHARIRAIDAEPARALPGVQAVITAADIPGVRAFDDALDVQDVLKVAQHAREPVLAWERVRMVGEPVALVAADDAASAQAGAAAVQVDYEVLEPIFAPEEALADTAVRLHESGNLYEMASVVKGDIEDALEETAVTVAAAYDLPSQDHVTLEPESMMAYTDEDGRVVVIGPTQQPHLRQAQIAAMLDAPLDQVRVIVPEMGGSFGGRHYFWPVVAIALPAFLLKRPVKLVFSRADVFTSTLKRHPYRFQCEMGADADGKLEGLRVTALGNAGPYGGAPGIAEFVTLCGIGPYHWPAIAYDNRVAHTNWANGGPFRGYGLPQGAFALECTLDGLATRLGIDPLALRRRNAVDQRSGTTLGQPFDEPFGFERVLAAAQPVWEELKGDTAVRRRTAKPQERFGAGVAAAWYRFSKTGATHTPAEAGLDADGRVTLYYTALKSGQGLDAVMSQLAGHELGISREAIRLVNSDTDETMNSHVYGGCRSTYWVGGAVQQAARRLRRALLATAADLLACAPSDLTLLDEGVRMAERPSRFVPFTRIAEVWRSAGQPLRFGGEMMASEKVGGGDGRGPLGHFVVGVALAQVRVDVKTGKTKVLHVTVVQDVGRAINPVDITGQIEGAVVMELGAVLMEEHIPGVTLGFKQYSIPRVRDVPDIRVILVEGTGQDGPLGAKGVGEAVMGHTRAAVANAIYDAAGVRVNRLPATPERLLELLAEI